MAVGSTGCDHLTKSRQSPARVKRSNLYMKCVKDKIRSAGPRPTEHHQWHLQRSALLGPRLLSHPLCTSCQYLISSARVGALALWAFSAVYNRVEGAQIQCTERVRAVTEKVTLLQVFKLELWAAYLSTIAVLLLLTLLFRRYWERSELISRTRRSSMLLHFADLVLHGECIQLPVRRLVSFRMLSLTIGIGMLFLGHLFAM